jgi:hypothetical protein
MKREPEANLKPVKPATEQLEMSLEIEELEPIVAPGIDHNSNETLVRDSDIESEVEAVDGLAVRHLNFIG